MSMWVELNEEWLIRSIQEGIELLFFEKSIILELSNPNNREELTLILQGKKEVPSIEDEKSIHETIIYLENKGIVQLSNKKPARKKRKTQFNKTLWNLRKEVVGSQGPIHSVYRLNRINSQFSPSLHMYSVKYSEKNTRTNKSSYAWSTGNDKSRIALAEIKAIMEGLERYACSIIPFNELIKSSFKKVGKEAIDPRQVTSYKEDQYKKGFSFFPFSENNNYFWKEVKTFPNNNSRYLPVECLYYPLDKKIIHHPYTYANSSGVAAGFYYKDALLRSIYENIERDAFMIVWLNHITMPTIQKNSLPNHIQMRIKKIEDLGYKLFFVNLTLDLTTVILAVVVSYEFQPALILGMSANINIIKAVSRALNEVEQQLYWNFRNSKKPHFLIDQKKVRDVSDHALLCYSSQNLEKASFLWSGEIQHIEIKQPIIHKELEVVINLLKNSKKKVFICDQTPQFLKKIGVLVLRTIIPGLVPISFGYGNEPLGMPRIKDFSQSQNSWINDRPFTHPFA